MNSNPTIPHIELLIFDLDGTLIDSSLDLILSVNATLRHLGREELDGPTIQSYIGRGAPDLIQRATGGNASQDEITAGLSYFIRYYAEHKLDNTRLYPGVRETLESLYMPPAHNGEAGVERRRRTLAVLTNKPERVSRSILHELDLLRIIPHVIGGNTLSAKKPDPLGIHTLLDAAGVSPEAAMIVGDSDVDVQAGDNAGIWTCGVSYGIGTIDTAVNPPDLMIDQLGELIGALPA
jgi:phosphoglycolate phosphatase